MSAQAVEVVYVEYTCGGCGDVFAVRKDAEPPYGYHGEVTWIGPHGGTGGTWFACKAACIRKAVETADE